ncbi:MAG TPA: hypothetical protein ENI68_11245 [Gammaproteobacteria bacterium]|nr:hypothetical protein [Gammaproteobacteria bacterium]
MIARGPNGVAPWQGHRARLNHDWLQVRYLTFLQSVTSEVDDWATSSRVQPEVKEGVLKWRERAKEWVELISDAEATLSPVRYLEVPPLSGMEPETRAWLSKCVHEIYCARTGIRETCLELADRLAKIEVLLQAIESGHAEQGAGNSLYTACLKFSRGVSSLPSAIVLP